MAVSLGSFAWSARERREADLFLADLLGYAPRPEYAEQQPQVCGFFRPDNTTRTITQIRDAIVARCNAEWTAWHTGSPPAPRLECDATMFGRLIGYYLAVNRSILPDSLTSVQANALGTINFGPLLGATAASTAQVTAIRTLLLAGAPDTSANAFINAAMSRARQGHDNVGSFRAWSAAFVSACVRGAAISEGIEAVTPPGRTHGGFNRPLLLPTLTHARYVIRARDDERAGRRGRYHAFGPSARAPQRADIIVQDRRDNIRPGQVRTLDTLPEDAETHGDIVVEVAADSVVTIGGNVADGVRKRRFLRDTTSGKLVTTVSQLYGQEDEAGGLPLVPGTSCQALADKSTRRIFALLTLVEECRDAPSGGGSGSGS